MSKGKRYLEAEKLVDREKSYDDTARVASYHCSNPLDIFFG